MYLIRSSSSACTIAIAPCRAHSSSSSRAEPWSSRIPALRRREVGREELERRRAVGDRVPIEADRRVRRRAGQARDGRRSRCASGRVKIRGRCSTARLRRTPVLDVDVHEGERDDGRRTAEERRAGRALGRLQPLLLALRPAAVHRLVDVRVRLDAAREHEHARRVDDPRPAVGGARVPARDEGDPLAGDADVETPSSARA